MTKRRIVIKLLEDNGFICEGGANHDRYKHPDGRATVVPRHREIGETLFKEIKKQAGLK